MFALLVDRIYYQCWTFPPVKFLYFNVVQSLAVFYGRNDWHYYLSQGLPLLLTTALPFTFPGVYQALAKSLPEDSPHTPNHVRRQLAGLTIFVTFAMSLLSHKEVRFIYPLLPCLHILAAPALVQYFLPALDPTFTRTRLPSTTLKLRRSLLGFLLSTNLIIATYTSIVHAQGPVTVMEYIRHQHAKYYLPARSPEEQIMTIGFLMPCHSTPWRSHLVFPTIEAWALTCEPPLHMDPSEKAKYLDEADQFYADPMVWLRNNIAGHPPRPRRLFSSNNIARKKSPRGLIHADSNVVAIMKSRKEWPDYLAFFEQLEGLMRFQLRDSGYRECWRGFSTRWHDDWRRQGDILVWCLWPDRKQEERDVKQETAKKAGQTLEKVKKKAQDQAANAKSQALLQKVRASTFLSQSSRFWWPRWPWGQGKSSSSKKPNNKDLWS